MTDHCTPQFFRALANLQERYPQVFATYSKNSWTTLHHRLTQTFGSSRTFAM